MDLWLWALLVVVLAVVYLLWPRGRSINIQKFPRKYPNEKGTSRPHYDVVVVGAGPAGATLGYFLAKMGRKVLVLEKKKFPRDKICGDALVKTAIEILDEMGIYEKLVSENKMFVADNGGLVSPAGLSYIGRSSAYMGRIPAAVACKRIHLDEAIARAAQGIGAELMENTPVKDAVFNKEKGLWTVSIEDSSTTYTGRVLVCADGATSQLAMKLGLVKQPPQTSCSRAYIEGGTHHFKADGVMFYPRKLLPGYAVLFRHPGNELNYCVYLIPGNPEVTNDKLSYWHEHLMKEDPNISRALGKGAKAERMKAASMRIGGEAITYGDHVIVVGDAAGFTDPMTGEGIHHSMHGGKVAAYFLDEALSVGNFDRAVMEEYQNRWINAFGHDFKWSMYLVQAAYHYPILLDAATAAIARKGDKFLATYADIMTSRIPKFHLLHPEFVIVIGFELIILLIKRLFRKMLGMKDKKDKTKDE